MIKVRFMHIRHYQNGSVMSNGGATVAYNVDEKDNVHSFAVARCHEKDHYCRRTGRIKAAGRLHSKNYLQTLPDPMPKDAFFDMLNFTVFSK